MGKDEVDHERGKLRFDPVTIKVTIKTSKLNEDIFTSFLVLVQEKGPQ